MYCSGCRFEVHGTCVKQVNINVYYDEGSQKADCPHYRSRERLALWASRHELALAAKAAMRPHDRLDCREILWPEGQEGCLEIVKSLVDRYDDVYGVFPAQALSAIIAFHWSESHRVYYPGDCLFYSPVSRPVKEPDTNKVRFFEFVGWARLI